MLGLLELDDSPAEASGDSASKATMNFIGTRKVYGYLAGLAAMRSA